jgi:UDP-N-acetyl-D-mannosaminuronic acid transferase (WecB/TagA/CpsF family)
MQLGQLGRWFYRANLEWVRWQPLVRIGARLVGVFYNTLV